jgi:polyisoprenoid-binding protein YceI
MTSFTRRRVHGQEVPATGVWEIRPERASIRFTLRRPGALAIRGQVSLDDGVILITADPHESVAAISIDARSLGTSRPRRDARRRARWLATHRFPTIDLLVDEVEQQTRWEWTALCRLRLRDVTIPIALCFTFDGVDDNDDALFRARTLLSIADLGIARYWLRLFGRSINVDIRAHVRARRISDIVTFASDLRHAHPSLG